MEPSPVPILIWELVGRVGVAEGSSSFSVSWVCDEVTFGVAVQKLKVS